MAVPTIPIWPTAGAPTTGPNPTPRLIEIVNFYVERLVKQYATKPKAQMTTALLCKQGAGDDIYSQLLGAFNLDTAVGAQLDIIGKYIGQNRLLGGGTSTALDFFGCVDTTNTLQNYYGLGDSSNPGVNANVLFIGSAVGPVQQSTALPDEQYRTVLKLKALLNTSNGTLASVMQALYNIYGIPGFTVGSPGVPPNIVNIAGGQVTSLFGTSPSGSGYTVGNGPYIYFSGGGGSGALGQAIIGFGRGIQGKIIGWTIFQAGSGYTSAPTAHYSSTLIQCVDNANMSVTYNVLPGVPISKSNLELFLPCPMGSEIIVNTF